jgi:hypothetical protein
MDMMTDFKGQNVPVQADVLRVWCKDSVVMVWIRTADKQIVHTDLIGYN